MCIICKINIPSTNIPLKNSTNPYIPRYLWCSNPPARALDTASPEHSLSRSNEHIGSVSWYREVWNTCDEKPTKIWKKKLVRYNSNEKDCELTANILYNTFIYGTSMQYACYISGKGRSPLCYLRLIEGNMQSSIADQKTADRIIRRIIREPSVF